jgi:hypothetical protein
MKLVLSGQRHNILPLAARCIYRQLADLFSFIATNCYWPAPLNWKPSRSWEWQHRTNKFQSTLAAGPVTDQSAVYNICKWK